MPNLNFLQSLEVVEKFVVEVSEIIWWGARDYLVLKGILVLVLALTQAEQQFPQKYDKIVGFGFIIHHTKSQPLPMPKHGQKVCGGGCGSGMEFYYSIQLRHT